MSAAHPHVMYFKYGFNYCSMLRDSCSDHSPKMLSTVAGTWEVHGSWFNRSVELKGSCCAVMETANPGWNCTSSYRALYRSGRTAIVPPIHSNI